MTGWSISPARPEWATALTELALRSKASWGYDEEFMRRVASELRIGEDDIKARPVFSWVEDERPLGFYALLPDPPEVELDLFFVEPEAQRRGIGRALFKHAVMTAARDGWKTMTIQSDPFAVPFYLSRGAFRVGESRSPSTGRMLPLLHYSLPEVLTDADALRTYLGEIAGYPVVSEEEVRTLAQEIEAGAEATDLLTNESLEADERRRLRATRTTGEESKQKLIRAHLMLVVSLARRYEGGPGGSLLDLIQEGNIGLIRAVDKYDWRKGSFATFATPFIRRAIDRAVRGPEV